MEKRATGSTAVGIKASHLRGVPVVVPPLSVQEMIAAEHSAEAYRVNVVAASINRAVNLLREFRSALITAAVTGQIDVTNSVRTELPSRAP